MNQFLELERYSTINKNETNRETKIAMSFSSPNFDSDIELIEKEFIVKTRKVDIGGDLNEIKPLCMHMFIDTTQIKQLEEAKAQNHYQKQMLANVSHEFRTPINAMNMSLTLMKDSIDEK